MTSPYDPSQYQPPQPPGPQPPVKKRRKWPWIAGGTVAVLFVIGSVVGNDESQTATTTAAASATASTTTTAAATSTTQASAAASPSASPAAAGDAPAAHAAAAAPPAAGSSADAALAKLATLPVKGRAPKTGYDRDQFGSSWTDDVAVAGGHNGCDTRNDILRRDLAAITFKPGTGDCTVLAGTLHDPYTGTTIAFRRGEGTSNDVQIDHVVALSNAWQTGAQQLSAQQRENLANDPRNLMAVDGPTNASKGDGDAATWLPPNKAYRCTYVAKQVDVKALYGLWVTRPEHDAITRILDNCGGQPPAPAAVSTPVTTPAPAPVVVETTPPAVHPAPAPAVASVYFKNCTAARAAGAAPLHAGQPGYRSGLDRDGDGIACDAG